VNRPQPARQAGRVQNLPHSRGNSPIRERRKIVHEAVTPKDKRGGYTFFVHAERLRLASLLPDIGGTCIHHFTTKDIQPLMFLVEVSCMLVSKKESNYKNLGPTA
jgi:hypothetical protein